ncbi:hypothetical protein GCM10010199_70590 [Dactylosporangium roseum]
MGSPKPSATGIGHIVYNWESSQPSEVHNDKTGNSRYKARYSRVRDRPGTAETSALWITVAAHTSSSINYPRSLANPGRTRMVDPSGNVRSSGGGTTSTPKTTPRLLSRLKRDNTDLADRVTHSEMTANAAAREMGWRHPLIVASSPERAIPHVVHHRSAQLRSGSPRPHPRPSHIYNGQRQRFSVPIFLNPGDQDRNICTNSC